MLVLIIDRSVQIIERLEEIIIELENITSVHRAVSYKEAKKLFKENKYDVVLLDLQGNESIRIIKEIKKVAEETCVIVLSIHMDNYLQERCKSFGADFFFDKYYDFEKLSGLLSGASFINAEK